jgi:hypothetical protein
VDDDVGAGGVLEAAARAPAVALRAARVLGDAGVQRAAGGELAGEGLGRDDAVAVAGAAAAEADRVEHAVAVERVVAAERGDQRVLGVADVEAVEVGGDRAGDDGEVVGVPLGVLRAPGAGAVRVIVVGGEQRRPGVHRARAHGGPPTMNAHAVVALPPRLSVSEPARRRGSGSRRRGR